MRERKNLKEGEFEKENLRENLREREGHLDEHLLSVHADAVTNVEGVHDEKEDE